MIEFTNFNIFKNQHKEKPEHPDYNISASVKDEATGEYENYSVGGAWLKDTKSGDKYFSCQLNKVYKDKDGFKIVSIPGEGSPAPAPAAPAAQVAYPAASDEIDPDDIPF